MFMPTAEEKKRLLRGTILRARQLGVDDALRGWSWSAPPLLSPYEVPLGLSEVANAYCTNGRDVYARRVLGEIPEPNEKIIFGGVQHTAFRDWIIHAKMTLYLCGAERSEEAMREIRAFPDPDLPEARSCVSYEANAIEFRFREALGQFSRLQTEEGALVAQVLPVTLGVMLDGAFLGLSRRLSTDLLNLGEPCILDIIFNDHKRDFHPLTVADYALILEAVYEFPVDMGITVYASLEASCLHIERQFVAYDGELAWSSSRLETKTITWSPTSQTPAPMNAARSGARSEEVLYSEVRRAKGGWMVQITLDSPEDLLRELESRVESSGESIPGIIWEELKLRYLHRLPERNMGDISARPKIQRSIRLQDEMRRKHEGNNYNATKFIHRMRGDG